MATDGPTPPPCDKEIFNRGELVARIDAASNATERWVQAVAADANARLDWHYAGGIARVLHLGNAESRSRVEDSIAKLEKNLKGRILS